MSVLFWWQNNKQATGPTGSGSPSITIQTVSGSGTVTIDGTGTPSITIHTASGSGVVTIDGSGSPTISIHTASGTGSVGQVTGSGTPEVPAPLTSSASGVVTITGTGSVTIPIQIAQGLSSIPFDGKGSILLTLTYEQWSGYSSIGNNYNINDHAYDVLSTYTGLNLELNDMMFYYLEEHEGLSGSLDDMLDQWDQIFRSAPSALESEDGTWLLQEDGSRIDLD
jgi:hypothetical protein